MSVGQFLVDSIERCRDNDVKIEFYPRFKLPADCGGEYHEEPPKGRPKMLKVATGLHSQSNKWDWLEIYVHEYCHSLQDEEGAFPDTGEDTGRLFCWLEDKTHPKPTRHHIRRIIEMESDCDRRSVKLIRKYNLPINIDRYIKCSNIYMWFYPQVLRRGKWVAKKKLMPYRVKEALNLAPSRFLSIDEYMTTPPELIEIFDKHTF